MTMHIHDDRARALAVLGLGPAATVADIETAYRRLVRRHHPDRSAAADSPERLAAIINAHRLLRTAPVSRPSQPASPLTKPIATTTTAGPRPPRDTGPPIVAGPVRYTPAPLYRRETP